MLGELEKFIILINNDQLRQSDAIIILEGDGPYRIGKGCELYHSKMAPNLVFSGGISDPGYGSYPLEMVKDEFEKHNVSIADIIHEDKSLHTRQQAEQIIRICEERQWKSLILVASHYHQFRAYLAFLKVLQEKGLDRSLIIWNAPVTTLPWFEKLPWGQRFTLLEQEFERIAKYTSMGHLSSFEDAINYQQWKELQA